MSLSDKILFDRTAGSFYYVFLRDNKDDNRRNDHNDGNTEHGDDLCVMYSLKRSKSNIEDQIVIDTLKIDKTAHRVFIDDKEVQLSLKEYDLLLYLVENRGIALNRESILEKVWGYDYFKDDRTLDTHIKLLRRSLGDYAKYITTIRGVGYRFEKDL